MMKKKLLMVVLSLSLIVTMMPAMAFADEDTETLQNEIAEEQVDEYEEVSAAGVTYGDWGAWSAWQDAAVAGSDTRQVQTRSVAASYDMETYTYSDSSSSSDRGYWPTAQGGTLRFHYTTTWDASVMNNLYGTYPAGTYYNPSISGAQNVAGKIYGATAYVSASVDSFHPMFIKRVNNKTQYRYRDRSVIEPPANDTPSQTDAGSEISDSTVSDAYFSDVSYTGKGVRPGVTIVVNGYTLVEGVDYTVTCRNNKKIGRATVIITGCGRYSGSITRTFRIVPKGCSLKSCKSKKGSGQCTVSWKKGPKGCSGYKVRYSTDPNFGSCKTKTIKGRNKTSCTLKKLTKGKTYYVQVCVYKTVKKTRYCSGWSKCKRVIVKKAVKKPKAKKKTKVSKDGDIGFNFSTPDGYYYNGIKVGNYFYCGVKNKIVRVNLKTKKKKTVTKYGSAYECAGDMCIKNGYLYFFAYDGEDYSYGALIRVRVDGKEKTVFWDDYANYHNNNYYTKLLGYEINGEKVRFVLERPIALYNVEYLLYTANLDGSDLRVEKTSNCVGDLRDNFTNHHHAGSNAKGYISYDKDIAKKGPGFKRYIWLKTPKWKLNLGREF